MKDVIQEKLKSYRTETKEDEENILKEMTQEIVLYGLEKAGFFEKAYFQGVTCLRIVHKLDRFSENLDFALREPDLEFNLDPYLEKVIEIMTVYGYNIEISGKDKATSHVKSRFLKDDSIKKQIDFKYHIDQRKKIQIKVEIDINPPSGANREVNYLDFPADFMILTHDMPSLLAGKCHALLCRSYVKGRDWYDYLWHIRKSTAINLPMFQEAINQSGPWKGEELLITKSWVYEELKKKIEALDWEEVKKDVMRFLRPGKSESLKLWSKEFFIKKTEKFISFLD